MSHFPLILLGNNIFFRLVIKCLAIVNQLNEKEVEKIMKNMNISSIQCRLDHHFRREKIVQEFSGNYINYWIPHLVKEFYLLYMSNNKLCLQFSAQIIAITFFPLQNSKLYILYSCKLSVSGSVWFQSTLIKFDRLDKE